MSTYLYDKALIQKLNKWTEKTNVHVYGPDDTRQMFELIADTNDDKPIELPIITLSRPTGYEIININKQPISYDGKTYAINSETGERYSLQINGIPIRIDYDLNVYARRYEEADALMRELIFNLINYPKLQITIPYHDSNLIKNCSIDISTTVEDNSSIPERFIRGQFTRLSIAFSIQDAYLWDTRIKTYLSMDGELLIQSDTHDIVKEELDLAN